MERTVHRRGRPLPSLLGLGLLLWLSAVPGWAGFEDGVHAYKSEDYATAFREWQPPGESPMSSSAKRPHAERAPHAQVPSRVRRAQERLQAAGFDPGSPDGTLGPKTREALRRYQHTQNLPATGELDAPTVEALGVR